MLCPDAHSLSRTGFYFDKWQVKVVRDNYLANNCDVDNSNVFKTQTLPRYARINPVHEPEVSPPLLGTHPHWHAIVLPSPLSHSDVPGGSRRVPGVPAAAARPTPFPKGT